MTPEQIMRSTLAELAAEGNEKAKFALRFCEEEHPSEPIPTKETICQALVEATKCINQAYDYADASTYACEQLDHARIHILKAVGLMVRL